MITQSVHTIHFSTRTVFEITNGRPQEAKIHSNQGLLKDDTKSSKNIQWTTPGFQKYIRYRIIESDPESPKCEDMQIMDDAKSPRTGISRTTQRVHIL